jgi:hypothetical protein
MRSLREPAPTGAGGIELRGRERQPPRVHRRRQRAAGAARRARLRQQAQRPPAAVLQQRPQAVQEDRLQQRPPQRRFLSAQNARLRATALAACAGARARRGCGGRHGHRRGVMHARELQAAQRQRQRRRRAREGAPRVQRRRRQRRDGSDGGLCPRSVSRPRRCRCHQRPRGGRCGCARRRRGRAGQRRRGGAQQVPEVEVRVQRGGFLACARTDKGTPHKPKGVKHGPPGSAGTAVEQRAPVPRPRSPRPQSYATRL